MHLGCMRTVATGSNVAEEGSGAGSVLSPARASNPTINGATMVTISSSTRAELVLERQLPNASAGCGEDRVGQRGSGDRRARFPDSSGRLEVAHEMDVNLRRLVDPHDAKVVEVRLFHAAVLERHFAPQGAADSEDDPAFDLRFDRVRVH